MSTLSTLKLVAVKKPRNMPAIVIRRNKLAAKLWEQINLAQSQLDGKPFVVMKYRSVKDSPRDYASKSKCLNASNPGGFKVRLEKYAWQVNTAAAPSS